MTVYLDIVFLENILMNYIILFGTGLIQKLKMSNLKLLLSSIIGAIYAIISYLNIIPIYSNFFMKIFLSILMIFVAYNPQKVKKMLKSLVLFYLISFGTGGCALALLYLIAPSKIFFKNGVLVGAYPMEVTIIAGFIGFLIIQYCFNTNKKRLQKKDFICEIKLKICDKIIQTRAFLDSGNNLRDPLTNEPVVIVEKEVINKYINIDDLNNFKGGDENLKIRLIPFKSIGKQNGILIGLRANYIEIKYDEEELVINNVIIGIYEKQISKNYSALIGLNLLNGGNKNEHNCNTQKNILGDSKRR